MNKKTSLKETINLLKEDLRSYEESFIKSIFFIPGYKYTFHHRICYYFSQYWFLKPLFILWWLYLKHLTYLYGIQTSWAYKLPSGITIAHFGGITFFPKCCGKNIIIRQGCVVGNAHKKGQGPQIGNNVTMGANSMIIGEINIGDNVIIGAGAVVISSVPDDCIVGGVPAKIIKKRS